MSRAAASANRPPGSRGLLRRVRATWNGVVLAESEDTIVVEGNHYFPRSAVRLELLRPSARHTWCPWKGVASYYDVVVEGEIKRGAAWYYPQTKPAADRIRGRVAFRRDVRVEQGVEQVGWAMDVRELHSRALAEFGERVHAVPNGAWGDGTPCAEWTVRDLVNHLVSEQRWAVPLLTGATIEGVGDRFDGDLLGGDPVSVWDDASREAVEAVAAVDLDRVVHLSYGDVPASSYIFELATDALVHAWDLARGIGAREQLDPELVTVVHDALAPRTAELAASGMFAPPVPVADDSGAQTRLLALTGRRG